MTRYLVALTYHFHLRPRDVDELYVWQFDLYAAAVDQIIKDNSRGG